MDNEMGSATAPPNSPVMASINATSTPMLDALSTLAAAELERQKSNEKAADQRSDFDIIKGQLEDLAQRMQTLHDERMKKLAWLLDLASTHPKLAKELTDREQRHFNTESSSAHSDFEQLDEWVKTGGNIDDLEALNERELAYQLAFITSRSEA